jgi:hypothetical protein
MNESPPGRGGEVDRHPVSVVVVYHVRAQYMTTNSQNQTPHVGKPPGHVATRDGPNRSVGDLVRHARL